GQRASLGPSTGDPIAIAPAEASVQTSTPAGTELPARPPTKSRDFAPVIAVISFLGALALIGVVLGGWAILTRADAPAAPPASTPAPSESSPPLAESAAPSASPSVAASSPPAAAASSASAPAPAASSAPARSPSAAVASSTAAPTPPPAPFRAPPAATPTP